MLETSSVIKSASQLSNFLKENNTTIDEHVRGVIYTPLIQAPNFSVDAVTQLFVDEADEQDLGSYRITMKLSEGNSKVVFVDFPSEIEPKLNAYLDLVGA